VLLDVRNLKRSEWRTLEKKGKEVVHKIDGSAKFWALFSPKDIFLGYRSLGGYCDRSCCYQIAHVSYALPWLGQPLRPPETHALLNNTFLGYSPSHIAVGRLGGDVKGRNGRVRREAGTQWLAIRSNSVLYGETIGASRVFFFFLEEREISYPRGTKKLLFEICISF
jgi:hypothetical protein